MVTTSVWLACRPPSPSNYHCIRHTWPRTFSHEPRLWMHTLCKFFLGLPSSVAVTYRNRERSSLRI